ncbi:hypothetical protein TNCV_1139361 [Trichonephila clavipes]|nr:hypothetical protein TNCV_1139361 [Trichonephila clavipes]
MLISCRGRRRKEKVRPKDRFLGAKHPHQTIISGSSFLTLSRPWMHAPPSQTISVVGPLPKQQMLRFSFFLFSQTVGTLRYCKGLASFIWQNSWPVQSSTLPALKSAFYD